MRIASLRSYRECPAGSGDKAPATSVSAAGEARSLPSPKLTPQEKRSTLYPYYAGFSEAFADTVLAELGVAEGSKVLDPWNGAGTTTYLAAKRGAFATGIDLNPALGVVARARSGTLHQLEEAVAAWDTLEHRLPAPAPAGKLGARMFELAQGNQGTVVGGASRAITMCIVFEVIRGAAKASLSANPTWYRASGADPQLEPQLLWEAGKRVIERLRPAYAGRLDEPRVRPALVSSDFLWTQIRPRKYDAFLTSPPYLTRIDYVKATLPELSVLCNLRRIDVDGLRETMLGTPLTSGAGAHVEAPLGRQAGDVLKRISEHTSKASSSYYFRFYRNYLVGLWRSIGKLSASLKADGQGCLVVQSSYYKDVYIDLASIAVEFAEAHGLHAQAKHSFEFQRSMVNVNSRSTARTLPVTESAIIFKKARQ